MIRKTRHKFLSNSFARFSLKWKKHVLPRLKKQFKDELPKLKLTNPGVNKRLQKIKTSKAIGPLSIDKGELPSDWIYANLSPVLKKKEKGDVHVAENYRPVSLTSVYCKLLEHIICKHVLNHLEKNNILINLTHGFHSRFSCETQLLITMNDLLHCNEQGS